MPSECLLAAIGVSVFTALLTAPVRAQTALDLTASQSPANSVWLDSLDLSKVSQGYGRSFIGGYFVDVPSHGAVLLKIGKPHRLRL